MLIRLFGVLLPLSIIGIIVSMLIIFRILEEILSSIIMNLLNAPYGRKIKI
jgi:hypothetical protein